MNVSSHHITPRKDFNYSTAPKHKTQSKEAQLWEVAVRVAGGFEPQNLVMSSLPAASAEIRANRSVAELHVSVACDGDNSDIGSISSLSFATDLLFNLDEVRADCTSGLTAHSNLVTMLRNRISLEKTYAHELSKMARCSRLDETEHGTMKNALASLRAQYLNTSVQHQQLAKSLEEDVLRPIETLYEFNSEKEQSLSRRINNVKKDVKVQEDAYRKDYNVFDKHFREASVSFSAAMDSGVSSTLLENQYRQRLAQMDIGSSPAKPSSTAITTRHDKSSGAATLKSINSSKIVNWLMSSDHHRKEDLGNNTVKLMEELYSVCICSAETDRRALLLQYDWQVIAPKFENIDVKSDIYDFIHSTRGSRAHFYLAGLTVNDLCNDSTRSLMTSPSSKPCRPLRKTCLDIRDISSKKVPFDDDGNQEPLREVLGDQLRGSYGFQCQQGQYLASHNEFSRLRIDCCSSSTENALAAGTEGGVIAKVQVSDGRAYTGAEMEDKSFIPQQCEPEHDNENHSPRVSPSTLTAHFLNHDDEAACPAALHNPALPTIGS
ncbi:unnamed protein product [Phytophthora fragariaefolia]|uniref:Unnamed protein product n=1 Tax=Phytophthora fragariaefolia TaxID=1490495 RepID=A0A9W6YIE6_9STRA|nr:unnamed protein product [Phytophthora fragariaefolia]